jgi:TolA-binding protein
MNEAAPPTLKSEDYEVAETSTDQSIENVALAGAAAIQRLVAERNALRDQLTAQQGKLNEMRSVNDDLRRRLLTIHQHYVEMAKRVVRNLEQVDGTIRDVTQEAFEGPMYREEAPPANSLAQRLAEADARAHPPGAPAAALS